MAFRKAKASTHERNEDVGISTKIQCVDVV